MIQEPNFHNPEFRYTTIKFFKRLMPYLIILMIVFLSYQFLFVDQSPDNGRISYFEDGLEHAGVEGQFHYLRFNNSSGGALRYVNLSDFGTSSPFYPVYVNDCPGNNTLFVGASCSYPPVLQKMTYIKYPSNETSVNASRPPFIWGLNNWPAGQFEKAFNTATFDRINKMEYLILQSGQRIYGTGLLRPPLNCVETTNISCQDSKIVIPSQAGITSLTAITTNVCNGSLYYASSNGVIGYFPPRCTNTSGATSVYKELCYSNSTHVSLGNPQSIQNYIYSLAFDPFTSNLMFSNTTGIYSMNGKHLDSVKQIIPGSSFRDILIDPVNDYLFAWDGSIIFEINPSNGSVLTSYPFNGSAFDFAFNSRTGNLFFSDNNTLAVFHDNLSNPISTFDIHFVSITCDPSLNVLIGVTGFQSRLYYIYTGYNFSADLMSAIDYQPAYPVTVSISGLPSGTQWGADLGGLKQCTTNKSMQFFETNGTYNYSIQGLPGYYASPSAGKLTIAGYQVTEEVSYKVTKYNVTFKEIGLPSKAEWQVSLYETDPNNSTLTTVTNNQSIIFNVQNGTYVFHLYNTSGYFSIGSVPASRILNVNGSSFTVTTFWKPKTATLEERYFTESAVIFFSVLAGAVIFNYYYKKKR